MSASSPDVSLDAPAARDAGASAVLSTEVGGALLCAWLGVLVSVILWRDASGAAGLFCPSATGCATVLRSRYASFGGLPLPLVGLAYYLAILGLVLASCTVGPGTFRRRLLEGALWLVVVGATYSAGLMAVQFGVLRAFCPLCTLSAVLTAALLFLLFRVGKGRAVTAAGAAPRAATMLALFAFFPAALLLISPSGAPERLWPVDLSTAQAAGPAEAPVQILVFSDFECHFCRELAPVLKRVREKFPQETRLIFRHFPLETHPRSFPAAVAAECAGEQGAFWAYHDRLFAGDGDLNDTALRTAATALGLDEARFTADLQSERIRRRVGASAAEAIRAGVDGTPAVFLNGRRWRGRLDEPSLVREIQALLAKAP